MRTIKWLVPYVIVSAVFIGVIIVTIFWMVTNWHPNQIQAQSIAITLGAVSGGLIGAFVALILWWKGTRASNARELLAEALAVQALKEAWIVDGQNCQEEMLSHNRNLTLSLNEKSLRLRRVEVRFVLDDARWNSPDNEYYGIIDYRRTWIVRDRVHQNEYSYRGGPPVDYHPALLTSRALEELCGWIERVASARNGWMLSRHGLEMLDPLLRAVAAEDRIEIFKKGDRLSPEAIKFLRNCRLAYQKQTPKEGSAVDI
jgi:hypothetical protein